MKIIESLKLKELAHVEDLDAPSTSLIHSEIIKNKPYLKNIYLEFYNVFKAAIGNAEKGKKIVEIGSGGGFCKEVIPAVITSDLIQLGNVDINFSATSMPFKDKSIDIFFMIDVLHHISNPPSFFRELERVLKKGGKVIMVEPANTIWGRFIYKNFHHEPFDPTGKWRFESTGPLTSANGALTWIIFCRDRLKFEKAFPSLQIKNIHLHTPFRYLISGGLSLKQLLPSATYPLLKGIESLVSPLNAYLAMFMTVELEKGE